MIENGGREESSREASNYLNSAFQNDNQQAFDSNKLSEQHCIHWLKSQTYPVSRLINTVALIGIFNGILIILQSALLAYLFQQLIIEKLLWTQLIQSFILLAVIFLVRSISGYFYQTLGYQIALKVKRSVRKQVLNKIYSLGTAYTKQQQSGELAASTLEHTEALDNYFSRYLPQQQLVVVLPLVMIAVVFPVNWVVGIIFLVTGPLIPVFMALVGMGAASANRNQFLALTRMSGYFLDRLQGLTTLKLFGQAEAELETIKAVSIGFRERTMAVLRIAFLSSAVLEFFSAVAVALVAVYVGLGLLGLVHFGPAVNISLQEALFVLLLAPEFFNPLKQLAVFYHDKAAAIGATDQLLKILDQPLIEQSHKQKHHSDYQIELQNVSKSYQDKKVITEINLQIQQGEKIAVVGESGVGKTTLFNLLLGFEKPGSGHVLIAGQLATTNIASDKIAWTGQKANLFYASISDNISLINPQINQQQIEEAAKITGVTEFSKQLEKGLDTLVGEQGYGLSGGQVQRIALARALVKKAEIILLDEPTAHLDQQNKLELIQMIKQFSKDKTVIIASHDPLVIDAMDRVVTLQ